MNGDGLEDCGAVKPAECQGRMAERLDALEEIAKEARDEARDGRKEMRETLTEVRSWMTAVNDRCADHRVEISMKLAAIPAEPKNGNGKSWTKHPITISIGASGLLAAGGAIVKLVEHLVTHH